MNCNKLMFNQNVQQIIRTKIQIHKRKVDRASCVKSKYVLISNKVILADSLL